MSIERSSVLAPIIGATIGTPPSRPLRGVDWRLFILVGIGQRTPPRRIGHATSLITKRFMAIAPDVSRPKEADRLVFLRLRAAATVPNSPIN